MGSEREGDAHGVGRSQNSERIDGVKMYLCTPAPQQWDNLTILFVPTENAYLAIAILDGRLMVITAHLRPVPVDGDSNGTTTTPDSPPIANNRNRLSPVLRKVSITPLTGMGTARCAMGAVELDGKLIVCGK